MSELNEDKNQNICSPINNVIKSLNMKKPSYITNNFISDTNKFGQNNFNGNSNFNSKVLSSDKYVNYVSGLNDVKNFNLNSIKRDKYFNMEIQSLKGKVNNDQFSNSTNNNFYSEMIQSTGYNGSRYMSPNNLKVNKKIYSEIESMKNSFNGFKTGKLATSNTYKKKANKILDLKSSISNTLNKSNNINFNNFNTAKQNDNFLKIRSHNSKINYNKHAGFNLFTSRNFVREKQPEDIDIRVFGKDFDAIDQFRQEMSGGKYQK